MQVRTPQINPHLPEQALGDESAPPINGRTSCFILLRPPGNTRRRLVLG
ncbi:hypothetical protein MA5S0422_1514 [Mycobacteroides abscessus 5S-0422]|uniref:Uncharacterized protein n=1 Tax=Mycobacteroides abscessus subsp. bolletii 50594 TaxID=1303024 RepID=A0AB33A8Y3_9MYCO|nr:hypothetical protein MASS_1522 [Mycobacteroides abscessus subsp. bolletii 50594]EIU16187.1 hypothetical protein MA5S0304_0528 [Mycobacteroides abscessus 5S-0304]EIU16868.1 hypothetical protein MA5S0421_0783 [Mycobacteroides abscessus 5S-0421]EIU18537.1 hypothetical protein MA5S0422_1514 [Mycobacteroides abscessus 5S-0422]EIU27869.1 hypothetical protein MA5S0708_1008 [Mycobacteroides abscessus 5S-0708]EIU33173.1 hypothetical protein MA5S0817_0560 [Mycobacteroides abscessus 5S-0817]EIU35145.